jgi:subtilase family serine protease
VLNGSGDMGSTCLNGSPNTCHVPASSPNATAVGGTTPNRSVGGTYGSETWWNSAWADRADLVQPFLRQAVLSEWTHECEPAFRA